MPKEMKEGKGQMKMGKRLKQLKDNGNEYKTSLDGLCFKHQ